MSNFEKIKDIIVKNLKKDGSTITEASRFGDDLGMDSLEQAELIMELEKEFNCEIPEEAAEKIATVGDAVKYLEDLQK